MLPKRIAEFDVENWERDLKQIFHTELFHRDRILSGKLGFALLTNRLFYAFTLSFNQLLLVCPLSCT